MAKKYTFNKKGQKRINNIKKHRHRLIALSIVAIALLIAFSLLLGNEIMSSKLNEDKIKEIPSSQVLFKSNDNYSKIASVTIHPLSDKSPCVIKFYRDDKLKASVIVKDEVPVTLEISSGTYKIKVGAGDSWFGNDKTFGSGGRYYSILLNDQEEIDIYNDYRYDISLEGLRNGALKTKYIHYSKF